MRSSDYKILRVTKYSDEVASQIGSMMPSLSGSASDLPIPVDVINSIINSNDTDLILAVHKEDSTKVGGVAVMNLTRGVIVKDGSTKNIKTWLEDFVVSVPRQGIGSLLWDEIISWSIERNANVLNFTSNPGKSDAHKFYQSKPSVRIRAMGETAYFQVDIAEIAKSL